jgi:hypothetical protein
MANNSFLPDRDTALLAWSLNFSSLITSTPTAYGLVAADATAFALLHTGYATALAACDPGQRNKSAVATKNSAKASLKTSARLLANKINGTASVTDAQKLELGLTVRAQPSPIPPPAFAPAVDLVSVVGRTVRIHIHDSQEANRRGRPVNVKGASVFSFVGAEPPAGPDGWKAEGITNMTKVDIAFPESVAAGAQVWITAQWGDYPFIDRLQDMHSKALGFMPKAQLEGKIAAGHVLIAEDEVRLPIGYCMSQDRYFKRDDVGIIYQMNVSPGAQRKLVAATLLKAVFDRAAYGCKLFCCWCAQDLDANYFWESLGFIPLAFRAGAGSGRDREDAHLLAASDSRRRYGADAVLVSREDRRGNDARGPACAADPAGRALEGPDADSSAPGAEGLWFASSSATPAGEQPRRVKKEKVKADPAHVAKARELRDRWLEQINASGGAVLSQGGQGKYDVSRQLACGAMGKGTAEIVVTPTPLLGAA